jgi:hypothetical protein
VFAAGLFLPVARLARCGGAGGAVLVLALLAAASGACPLSFMGSGSVQLSLPDRLIINLFINCSAADGLPGREGGHPARYTAAPHSAGVGKVGTARHRRFQAGPIFVAFRNHTGVAQSSPVIIYEEEKCGHINEISCAKKVHCQ